MPNAKYYRAVPQPTPSIEGLHEAVNAVKDNVEVMTNQKGPVTASMVTWQDLVDLGLIAADQVPTR